MSDTLWQRLAEERARLTGWRGSLREGEQALAAARAALWQRAQAPDVAEAALAAVLERLRGQHDLQPWQDWPGCYARPDDWALLVLRYLADTDIGPERYLGAEIPFSVAWLLRGRARSFLVWLLGTPERCLIVPGADLWDWIGVHWLRWEEGAFHVILRWDEAAARCYLHTLLQTRPRHRQRQANLCQQGSLDVTDHLNRFDWLDMG